MSNEDIAEILGVVLLALTGGIIVVPLLSKDNLQVFCKSER